MNVLLSFSYRKFCPMKKFPAFPSQGRKRGKRDIQDHSGVILEPPSGNPF